LKVALLDRTHPLLAERLAAAGHVCVALHEHGAEELKKELHDVEGVIVRSRRLTGDLLQHAPVLRFIGRLGSGVENIDRSYCTEKDIKLYSSPEGNRDGVGETAVMLLLMLLKHAARANGQVHRGLWSREENRGTDLEGKTVGIIGFGHMGSAFAQRLQGFGTRILAYDKYVKDYAPPHVQETTLEQLQDESDAVSLHLPLTGETRHYINAGFVQRMKKPFWLINTARGPVVDTRAVLDGLDDGKILGAGLDVLEFERPDLSGLDPAQDPGTLSRLLADDRVVLTPHIAGVTHDGARKMAEVLADKILKDFPHGR
jgi:D-3-phosphoglycerate dehydrogenase